MTADEGKTRKSWPTWLFVVIIIALIYIVLGQYQSNQDAQAVFSSQTAEAGVQHSISLTATASIATLIQSCANITTPPLIAQTKPCFIGRIVKAEDLTGADQIPLFYAYFDFMPNTFFTIGNLDLAGYTGRCIEVFGQINLLQGVPHMAVLDSIGDEPVRTISDDVCSNIL